MRVEMKEEEIKRSKENKKKINWNIL